MRHRLYLFAVVGLGVMAAVAEGHTPAAPAPLAVYDEATLRQAGFDTDAANLLNVLHQHTSSAGDQRRLNTLIAQLGSSQFKERESAARELMVIGQPALAPLREARQKQVDPEVRWRAEDLIALLERELDAWVMSAVRRVIHLRAGGTAAQLLELLPTVDWEIQDEIFRGLPEVARHHGQLDPALLAALEDKLPLRRAAAALAVALTGSDADRLRIRKLLDDRDASVRLHAAQGLLAAHDAASLPVLIALLNESNVELSWPAEELLHWVAGEQAPTAMVGAASAKEREEAVAAWTAWRQTYGQKINWEQVEQAPRRPGLYLACMNKCVWLGGCDGKRWTLERPYAAHDVLLLPSNQLLVVPYSGEHKLVKCDLTGKDQWQRPRTGGDCVMCQRLPNGHLFVVSSWLSEELTVEGQKVSSTSTEEKQPPDDAQKLQVSSTNSEEGPHPDDAWKLRTGAVHLKTEKNLLQKCAFLPDGRRVLADWQRNRVVERDSHDKPLRELPVHNPWSVEALPNGHYLVSTSLPTQRLVELDPAGRTLWEMDTPNTVVRVRSVLGHVRIGFDKPRPPGFNLDTAAQRVRGLQQADAESRRRAAALLGFLCPTDVASLQALTTALDDPSAEVRAEVRATLGMIGEAASPALGHALKKGAHQDRLGAVLELWHMKGAARQAVPDLIDVIKAGRVERALRQATPVLSQFGPLTKHTLPLLRAAAPSTEETDELCIHAMHVLDGIAPEAAQGAVPALLDVVKDGNRSNSIRYTAARTLSRLGLAAKQTVPVFGELLRDPNLSPYLAYALLDGLSTMGPDGVLGLAEATKAGNAATRRKALEFLVVRGDEAVLALPAVERALTDPDEQVRAAAKLAHQRIVAFLKRNNQTLVR